MIRRDGRDELWCGAVVSFTNIDGLSLRVWGSGELLSVPRWNIRGACVIGMHSYRQLVEVWQRQRAGDPAFLIVPKGPKREPIVELSDESARMAQNYATPRGLTLEQAVCEMIDRGARRLAALVKDQRKQEERRRLRR